MSRSRSKPPSTILQPVNSHCRVVAILLATLLIVMLIIPNNANRIEYDQLESTANEQFQQVTQPSENLTYIQSEEDDWLHGWAYRKSHAIEISPGAGTNYTVPIIVYEEGRRYLIKKIEEISTDEVDCILFPGGFSPDALRFHEETLKLVRECHEKGKIIAAICHGPWILISAGLMSGKKATSYRPVKDDLINAGAKYMDAPAVRDGNIITGRVPDDLPEFCRAPLILSVRLQFRRDAFRPYVSLNV